MRDRPTQEVFLRDVAHHAMTIVRDDGAHRHLRFAKPGTGCMHFEIITWPGYLCYVGDMGAFVFQRLSDMFEFFWRGSGDALTINPQYWAEKVEAQDKNGGLKEYVPDKFRAAINQWMDESEGVTDEIREVVELDVLCYAEDGEYAARNAAASFDHNGFRFDDFWEVDLTEYTYRFIWCCYAIVWAIRQYDAWHGTSSPAATVVSNAALPSQRDGAAIYSQEVA